LKVIRDDASTRSNNQNQFEIQIRVNGYIGKQRHDRAWISIHVQTQLTIFTFFVLTTSLSQICTLLFVGQTLATSRRTIKCIISQDTSAIIQIAQYYLFDVSCLKTDVVPRRRIGEDRRKYLKSRLQGNIQKDNPVG